MPLSMKCLYNSPALGYTNRNIPFVICYLLLGLSFTRASKVISGSRVRGQSQHLTQRRVQKPGKYCIDSIVVVGTLPQRVW